MTDLHGVSMFSGIGLLDLAMHRAGITPALLCEKDNAARQVLARHYPDVPIHDDVTELTAGDLHSAGADPSRTVLHGGFPCQDLSVAGARRGMGEGTRSGLYWQVVRLLDDFRPRWVVLENVPGLLSSHGGRDMGAVVGSLGELGYGYAWRVLDAQHFGVPQRRRRVVIVGHLGAPWGAPAEVLLEPEGGRGDSAAFRGAGSGVARPSKGRARGGRVAGTLPGHHGRMTAEDALTQPVAALTATGVGTSGADDNQAQAGHLIACVTGDHTHALTAEGHDASEDGTGRGCPIVAATLTAGTSRPGTSAPGRRQEDDYNLVAFDPKAGGNSTSSGAFEDGTGITPTLAGQRPHAISTRTIVRRLTPLECERLQGAPDGWTDTGQADSPRYRQLGNAVAVPVFEWVGRRLAAVDATIRVSQETP